MEQSLVKSAIPRQEYIYVVAVLYEISAYMRASLKTFLILFPISKEKGLVSIPKSAKRKQSFLNISQMTKLYNLFVSKKYPEQWSEEYVKRTHYSSGLFLA